MRILHLFSDWKWTGPAEPALSLAAELARRGHEVHFAFPEPPLEVEDSVGMRASRLPVRPVRGLTLRKHFAPIDNLFDIRACAGLVGELGIEVVHAHRDQDHLIGGAGARLAGTGAAVVRTNHTARPFDPFSVRHRILVHALTDRLVEISSRAMDADRESFGIPAGLSSVVETAVDLRRFRPGQAGGMRAELGIGENEVVVGIVARVQKKRKFELLFEAFRRALVSRPELKLLLVGRGTRFDEVAARPVSELGLEDRVMLAGYRGGDYQRVLGCFDMKVFLVPGTDGSCRAVREAMAAGVPVVATRRGILPEIVEPGAGLLVDEDPADLARAMVRLAGDAPLRRAMAAGARRTAERRFDPERQAARIEQVYAEAVHRARRRAGMDGRPVVAGEALASARRPGECGTGPAGGPPPEPIARPSSAEASGSRSAPGGAASGAKPDVSVVLVNWNGKALLPDCLASIRDHPDGLSVETLLVDNGSTDGSEAYVRENWPGVRWVGNSCNRGFGAANNQAFELAGADKVLLLNTDARLKAGTLRALCGLLDGAPRAAAVTPALEGADGRPQNAFDSFPALSTELLNKHLLRRLFPSRFPSKLFEGTDPVEIDSALGACLLLRRSALDQAGGFDEGYFFFLEETDLCLRLKRAGWSVWLLPSAKAVHLGGASKSSARAEAWIEYYRSLYRYFRKNHSRSACLALRAGRFAKLFLNLGGSALLMALTLGRHGGSRRRLPIYARLLGWHLRGCPETEGLRRRIGD